MEKIKPSPHEVYEVLEERKKLLQIRVQIEVMLDQVKNALNCLAVENYQLTQSELSDEFSDKEESREISDQISATGVKQEIHKTILNVEQERETIIINQQFLDIDIKPCFEEMEIDSDEELDQL